MHLMDTFLKGVNMVWADSFTGLAAGASMRKILQLGSGQEGFRIMAPGAAQLAAFKEYGGAYAWSVVVGTALYVKNDTHDRPPIVNVYSYYNRCRPLVNHWIIVLRDRAVKR